MATPHDRRNISPDNLSLFSQAMLLARPWLGAQYARLNSARLGRFAHAPVSLPVPVYSIGNITFGGVGKTPLVVGLAQWLVAQGHRPGVIGSGHRGARRRAGALVSDGLRPLLDVASVGEEAVLLAHALKPLGVPVAAGMYRERVGEMLIARCGVDCLIIDDGFQYRSLMRDADIVVIDATNPFGAAGMEDYGYLREPVESLARASALLITKANLIPLLDLPQEGVIVHRDWLLKQLARVVPESVPRIDVPLLDPHLERVWHPAEDTAPDVDPIADPLHPEDAPQARLARPDLPGIEETRAPSRLMPVSALGNPEAFEATCRLAGLAIAQPIRYEDHYLYTLSDLMWWNQLLAHGTFGGLVVSSKDWIKIHPMRRVLQMPVWVLTATLAVPDWAAVLGPDWESRYEPGVVPPHS